MKKNQGKSPFFAKFLEAQKIEKETEIVGGGGPTTKIRDTPIETHKFPSDSDEWDVTLKYPSDGDEGALL